MGRAHLPRQIVLVDADKDSRDLAAALFEESGLEVVDCDDWLVALAHLEAAADRVALLFGDLDGDAAGSVAVHRIATRWPAVRLVLTGSQSRPAPEAAHFLPKPWRALEVLVAAERAAGMRG